MTAERQTHPGRPRRPREDRLGRVIVLAVCLAMLAAGFALEPARDERPVALAGFALPPLCMMKMSTGLDCPGCGLTRSWVSALHGDWRASLGFHRLGWLVLFYVALQAARQTAWLAFAGARGRVEAWGRWLDRGLAVVVALLGVNWLWNFL